MARATSKKNDSLIPNRITALPVRKTGSIVAGVIVAVLAVLFIQGLVTNERFEWNVVWKYLFNEHVLDGIGWTLILTASSMVIATILAVILAVMRASSNVVLRGVSWFFIWFFRGTPVYTQLVFWGLFSVLVPKLSIGIPLGPQLFSIDSATIVTATVGAILGLALNESAYLAEIVRAGLEAVDVGQSEAAQALGMRRRAIMGRIILPQAMRIIVPPVGNETIGMLKTTSLVLAVPFTLDLQFATNAIANRIYKPIPLLIVAAFWYLLITTLLMVIQSRLERYFGKGFEQRAIMAADVDPHFPGKTSGDLKNDVSKVNQSSWVGLNA